jgi:hypothetical protein
MSTQCPIPKLEGEGVFLCPEPYYLSGYATNSITLEITGSHRPHRNTKVETPSGETKPTWRILHILLKTTIVRNEISIPFKKN